MTSRKYVLVDVIIFLAVFVSGVNAIYTLDITTTGDDTITDALHEESFNAKNMLIDSMCSINEGCNVSNELIIAPHIYPNMVYYDINTTTINCYVAGSLLIGSAEVGAITYNSKNQVKSIKCLFNVSKCLISISLNTSFNATSIYSTNNILSASWQSKLQHTLYNYDAHSTTSILAPHIKMTGNGTSVKYLYVGYDVVFGYTFKNIYEPYQHSGTAFNVTSEITYNETALDLIYCSFSFQYGDIPTSISRYNDCTYNATHTGTYDFSVFVFDNSTLYNDTAVSTIYVVNLTVNGSSEDVGYWQDADLYATIKGNATEIEIVGADWNYTEINETGDLTVSTSSCMMDLNAYISPTEHLYYCSSIVWSSGTHNVSFYVLDDIDGDESMDVFATNTTAFDVSFGKVDIWNIKYNNGLPQAIILKNQTFNLTANISIWDGDVWDLNVSLVSSNPEIINTTGHALKALGNKKNGNTTTIFWENLFVNNTGLLKLSINATPANGTPAVLEKYIQVVDVVAIVKNSTVNITAIQEIQVMFAGNFSKANYLNITLENEFGLKNYTASSVFYEVPPDECYSFEGKAENAALLSKGTIANSGGGFITYNPNATIDDNNGTYWYGITTTTDSAELNITFNESRSISDIKLLWNDNNGNANVSVFVHYYETSSNFGTTGLDSEEPKLVKKLMYGGIDPPDSTNKSNYEIFEHIKKIQIVMNANNSALNIYSLEAYTMPSDDAVSPCFIYNFTYYPYRSGNYEITPTLFLESSTARNPNAKDFFVNFGEPQFDFGEKIFVLGEQAYDPKITAINGDLRNMTVNLLSSNTSVVDLSAGENISKNLSFIPYNSFETIIWNINATSENFLNITLIANSSIANITANKTEQFIVIASDEIPPTVNDFWFQYTETNMTNLKTDFIIYANITDNGTYVLNASANVFGPNNLKFNKTVTTKESRDIWKITLNEKLNETGNYTVNIFAYDLLGNMNWSNEGPGTSNRSLNITDKYHFSPLAYTIYNRGETASINLLDINNNTVAGANWIVNITKYNETEKNALNETADLYQYNIKTNDTDGKYSIFANASKNKNYVYLNHNFSFNVSSALTVYSNTSFDAEYTVNENLPYFTASVYNIRGEELTGTITTLDYDLYVEDMGYISGLFRSLTQYNAPASSGTSKTLTINASDVFNNTGETTAIIKTSTTGTVLPPGGGGSTSSPQVDGFDTIATPENKTPEINFNYTIENTERTITQGVTESIMATIANTGEVPIIASTKTSETPLNITIDERFELTVGADKSFKILVYANLSIEPKIYYVDIILYNENHNIEKTRTLKINVNRNLEQTYLESIKESLKEINKELDSFSAAGIDTTLLKEKTRKIADYITEAEQAIISDNYPNLKTANINADNLVRQVWAETIPLRTTKFIYENKWELICTGVGSLILIYLLMYFIIPYAKISSRIRRLTRQEKIIINTRKSTEKKYFMRQVNETTFNKIMAEEEGKLLKLKSEVAKLTQEKALLRHFKIRECLHLEDEKKKNKKRVEKERDLKEKAKRNVSDVILEHDMKKKSIFEKIFKKKKRKEFVFETNTKKLKEIPKDVPRKQNEKIKESFFKKLFNKKPNPKMLSEPITTNSFKAEQASVEYLKTESVPLLQSRTKEQTYRPPIVQKEKTIYSTNTNTLADDLMEIKRKIKDMKKTQ